MRPEFEPAIAARLTPDSRVLDVGGARNPSPFATHMIDIVPRREAGLWGETLPDHAPPDSCWVVHDICSAEPFPFPDKYFDFVICGHTLEDVRDPVRVCQELSRVAKAGYVETPSPVMELTRGVDRAGRGWVGYAHHRWIVDVRDGELVFLFKPHFLRASRRFCFPPRMAQRWTREGRRSTHLLWEGELRARELMIVDRDPMEAEIERIVRAEIGETMAMRWARLRGRLFALGAHASDRLGVRPMLRPVVAQFQRWR